MKRISLLLLMLLALPGMLLAQNTVTVRALNVVQTANNSVEWDIYMQRTSATWTELATHQYIFTFNTAVKQAAGFLYFTFNAGTSTLSNAAQIPNQSRFSISTNPNQLRIATPSPPGAGSGSIISDTYPGTRILRVKLISTSAANGAGTPVSFAAQPFNLAWKTSGTAPNSQINGYVSGVNVILTSTFEGSSTIVLPVELTSFTARYNGKSVDLKWSTATETNNMGFDVLRSTDPTDEGSWENLGFVDGSGTSNVPHSYTFEDANAPQSGVVYYRLRQIDRDGKTNLSSMVNVIIGAVDGFKLFANYPNPFTGSTSISFNLPEDRFVSIKMYDMTGRQVKETIEGSMRAGFNSVTVDASGLQPGNYRYIVTAGTAVQSAMMTVAK